MTKLFSNGKSQDANDSTAFYCLLVECNRPSRIQNKYRNTRETLQILLPNSHSDPVWSALVISVDNFIYFGTVPTNCLAALRL